MKFKLSFFLLFLSFFESKAQDSLKLEELVVVGSRFSQKRIDSPNQIQKIEAKEIKSLEARNTASLIEKSGKAFVQYSQNGGGSPVLRGFEGNKILLVLDGVRLNNAIFRGGHLQNILRIDPNFIDQVEILNGPGSILYGSDALGGVIAFNSLKSDFSKNEVSFNTRFASANTEFSNNLIAKFKKNNFTSITGISNSDFGDLKMGKNYRGKFEGFGLNPQYFVKKNDNDFELVENPDPYIQRPSGYSQININQKIAYSKRNFGLSYFTFFTETSLVPRYDRLSEKTEAIKPVFKTWSYGPEKMWFNSLQLNSKTEKSIYDFAKINLSYQLVNESRISQRVNSDFERNQLEKVNVLGMNLDFTKSKDYLTVFYGSEVQLNFVDSKAYFENIDNIRTTAETRYPDGGSKVFSSALYLNGIYKFSPKLDMQAGLRQTYYYLNAKFINKANFALQFPDLSQKTHDLSYSFSLNFKPNVNSKISAVINKGFRNPNVDDAGKVYESTASRLVIPNGSISPEKVLNKELNFYAFSKKGFLDLAIYHTSFTDILALAPALYNGQSELLVNNIQAKILSTQNLGKAYIYGLNLNTKYIFSDFITLNSQLTKTWGYFENKSPISHIPPLYGRVGAESILKNFRFEYFMLFNAKKPLEKYALNGEDNPQFATLAGALAYKTNNFRVRYNLAKKWQIQGSIENILDVNYRNFSSGISGPGRNFILSLRFN